MILTRIRKGRVSIEYHCHMTRRELAKTGLSSAILAPGALMQSSARAAMQAKAPRAENPKPNIVLMLADNLGYGELGVYGGGILRGAPTPRIDKLAGEGMRLLNFNVEAQCTPSRSALMTGRYPIRSGTHTVPRGGRSGRTDPLGNHACAAPLRPRLCHGHLG